MKPDPAYNRERVIAECKAFLAQMDFAELAQRALRRAGRRTGGAR